MSQEQRRFRQFVPKYIHNNNNLHIDKFSTNDILSALKKLKPKFTKGPDDVPAFIVRDCAHAFVEPLCIIFNMSLKSGIFPDIWKKSRVCPVYKKGEKNNIENYRQITIICNFAKVFEIALHNVLYPHIEGQISVHQHGFVKNRSTVSNLFCITQYVAQYMDLNGQVDVLYTDFSKAFDRVDHHLLLHKLDLAGLSMLLLNLFNSYLSQRTQYVECRGVKSFEISVTSGVPQGSVLGPLLFILFINDIVDNLDVCYLLYADDMKLFCNVNSEADCEKLQNELKKVNDWCSLNNLPLNVEKCNVMSYYRKQSPILKEYQLNDKILHRPKHMKDLGVTFDSELTFNVHVNNIRQSSFKNLGFVIRNSTGFDDVYTLTLLFNSFVRSKLEYASLIWNPSYLTYIDSLEVVQRRFLKYLSFKEDGLYPPIGIPQSLLLDRFSSSSLQDRRIRQSLIFLYKILNNKIDCPQILEQIRFHVPRIEARNNITLYLAKSRTNLLKYSPLHFMCDNYNSLQDRVDIFNCSINKLKTLDTVR